LFSDTSKPLNVRTVSPVLTDKSSSGRYQEQAMIVTVVSIIAEITRGLQGE
jgi:hypothetical protein